MCTKMLIQIGKLETEELGTFRNTESSGPSATLPSGQDFLDLVVCPEQQVLGLHCSDRKDYYHQLRTSRSRWRSNTVGPVVDEDLVKDTFAYAEFLAASKKKTYNRYEQGDFLGGIPSSLYQHYQLEKWPSLSNQYYKVTMPG